MICKSQQAKIKYNKTKAIKLIVFKIRNWKKIKTVEILKELTSSKIPFITKFLALTALEVLNKKRLKYLI